jgi:DNA-directed RNA polymerase subunit RPC12/RpoP
MYRCEDCGELFETPFEYEERDVGYMADLCPHCHSDEIEEVKECKFCGEYAGYLTIDGFCNACCKNTKRKFNLWLRNKFEDEELQILKEEFGIEPIE